MASTMASAPSLPSKKRKASTTSISSIDDDVSITSESNNSDGNNNNDNANKNNIQNGQQPGEASSLLAEASLNESRIPDKQSEDASFANAAIPLNKEATSSSAAASLSEIRIPGQQSEETLSSKAAISTPLNEGAPSSSDGPGNQSEETTFLKAAIPLSEEALSSPAAAPVSEIRVPSTKADETTSSKAEISTPLNEEGSSLSAPVSPNELPGKKAEESASPKAAISIPLNEEGSSLSAAASLNGQPAKQSEETSSSKAAIPLNEEAPSSSDGPGNQSEDIAFSKAARSLNDEPPSSSVAASVSEIRMPITKVETASSKADISTPLNKDGPSLSAAVSLNDLLGKKAEDSASLEAAIPLNEEASSLAAPAAPAPAAAASLIESRILAMQSEETTLPLNEEVSSLLVAAPLNKLAGEKAEETSSSKAAIPLNEEASSLSAAASLSESRIPAMQSDETAIPLNEKASSLLAAAYLNENRLPRKKSEETSSSKAGIPLNGDGSSLSAAASLNESRLPRKKSEDTKFSFNVSFNEESSLTAAASLIESRLPRKKSEETASSKASILLNEESMSLSASAFLNESRLPRKKSEETASSKAAIPLNESRLPSKKRKGSLDTNYTFHFDEDSRKRKFSHDSSATFEGDFWRRKLSYDSNSEDFQTQRRKLSDNSNSILRIDDLMAPEPLPALPILLDPAANSESSAQLLELQQIEPTDYREHLDSQDMSALEHLDALGTDSVVLPLHALAQQPFDPTNAAAVAQRNPDTSDTSSNGTFASSGQRLLLEAIMMATSGSQTGGGSGSYGGFESLPKEQLFESLPKEQPFVKDQLYPRSNAGRDRLESWGGMSDLSLPHLGSAEIAMASAALQQQQQQNQPQLDQQQQQQQHLHPGHPSQQEVGYPNLEETSKPSAIPSRISLERDRLNSIASLSEFSLSGMPNMSLEGIDMSGDIQAFVAMAMASVGDQLAELAGAVESVAFTPDYEVLDNLKGDKTGTESENSSVASPLIGAMLDMARGGRHGGRSRNRPRAWSASSGKISVDYEAVAAAVDAAHAATGTLDLEAIGSMAPPPPPSGSLSIGSRDQKRKRRQLPLNRNRGSSASSDDREQISSLPPVQSSISDGEMERIRERARAAAGYKPPSKKNASGQKSSLPPIKKRAKRNSPEPDRQNSAYAHIGTPKVSNRTTKAAPKSAPYTPLAPTSEVSGKSSKGQANQKWESMFDCLIGFIEDRRKEELNSMTEEEKKAWVWDGNVPTTYKAKDGKALGRWVNNQRSAKSKGSLKDEREHRLVDAGLKWSVLASNSWNEMLEELRIYVRETVKQGIKWDGNVPTNYQIKTRPNGRFAGEDKNLGRWVNRQRSLFQAGKLRKDRQLSLEKLGLKWSMLATTSWDSMYETLCDYVDEKKKGGGDWDGNVPANFRTNENPPRALGRWINRQRSAFMKNKLKKEYMEMLNTVGLKWSVHERSERSKSEGRGDAFDEDDDEMDDDDFVVADEPNGVKEENSSGKENAEETAPDRNLSMSRENAEATAPAPSPAPDTYISISRDDTIPKTEEKVESQII